MQHDWNKDEYYNRAHLRLRLVAHLLNSYDLMNSKVLDVGCGPALVTQLCNFQKGYVGLDAFAGSAEDSKNKAHIECWSWDDNVPRPLAEKNEFEIIIASGFLEYINARDAFFKQAVAALKPGGALITSMTNPLWWRYSFKALTLPSKWHPQWKCLTPPEELRKMAEKAGLQLFSYIPLFRFRREFPYDKTLLRFRKFPAYGDRIKFTILAQQFILEFRRPSNE